MRTNIVFLAIGIMKYAISFVLTFAFRLLSPFLGLWNVSPLMATQFTGAKAYGPYVGFLYGALSILLLDIFVGRVGEWTLITALTYGVVGVWGALYLREKSANAYNFAIASIVGTLFFDLVTGVFMGPLLYGQPWASAILGQIPFTLRHLSGNVLFAVVLAPWFYRQIMTNKSWDVASHKMKSILS